MNKKENMKKNIMNYLDDFEKYGLIQEEASESGEYKKANATLKKLEEILWIAKVDSNSEEFYLKILSTSKRKCTLINACAHMMKLNIQTDLARKELEKIANNPEKSIDRLSARLFLQEWDNGNIRPLD